MFKFEIFKMKLYFWLDFDFDKSKIINHLMPSDNVKIPQNEYSFMLV